MTLRLDNTEKLLCAARKPLVLQGKSGQIDGYLVLKSGLGPCQNARSYYPGGA